MAIKVTSGGMIGNYLHPIIFCRRSLLRMNGWEVMYFRAWQGSMGGIGMWHVAARRLKTGENIASGRIIHPWITRLNKESRLEEVF